MPSFERQFAMTDPVLFRRAQWLIVWRVVLIFLLLLATWWWTSSFLGLSINIFPRGLFFFFVFSAGLSAVYYLLLRTRQDLMMQIRGQLLIDAILVTWLVSQTGDIFSPFITLYIILVTVTGYLLGRTDTLAVAGLSAALFTVLSFSTTQSLLGGSTDDQPVSRVAQAIAFNIIGILIVGLLSARLAERRRIGEDLRYTEESFADLHILHERIVDSISSGLMTTDLEGRIFAFNRAAEGISGLDADKVIGMSIFSIFDDAGRVSIEKALSGFRENRSLNNTFETGFKLGDASDAVIECAAVPLLAKNGSPNGLIVTFQDITKIRVLEETVRRSDRLAAVGRMAAGLAHEIRNPLGSMSSALQFLNERTRPATEEASLMNVVLRESDRLNSIITNFLAYARPSANGFDSQQRAATDVCEALRDCLALLTHSPEINEHHRFEIGIPDEPIIVHVNETALKQVFWNLLRNAVAAMPGGGTLSVSIEKDSQTKIHISDTGTGIAPEELQHLFEPFAVGSTGTGLGLSIVHKIISDHGGSIDLESELGKGTHFVIELPNQK